MDHVFLSTYTLWFFCWKFDIWRNSHFSQCLHIGSVMEQPFTKFVGWALNLGISLRRKLTISSGLLWVCFFAGTLCRIFDFPHTWMLSNVLFFQIVSCQHLLGALDGLLYVSTRILLLSLPVAFLRGSQCFPASETWLRWNWNQSFRFSQIGYNDENKVFSVLFSFQRRKLGTQLLPLPDQACNTVGKEGGKGEKKCHKIVNYFECGLFLIGHLLSCLYTSDCFQSSYRLF